MPRIRARCSTSRSSSVAPASARTRDLANMAGWSSASTSTSKSRSARALVHQVCCVLAPKTRPRTRRRLCLPAPDTAVLGVVCTRRARGGRAPNVRSRFEHTHLDVTSSAPAPRIRATASASAVAWPCMARGGPRLRAGRDDADEQGEFDGCRRRRLRRASTGGGARAARGARHEPRLPDARAACAALYRHRPRWPGRQPHRAP